MLMFAACSARVEYAPSRAESGTTAVNINTATVEELEKLPHIGRKTAEAIVRFRAENGEFRSIDQLLMIRGVSETRLAEIRPFLKAQ